VRKIDIIYFRNKFHLPSPNLYYRQKQNFRHTFVLPPSCCLSFCK